MDSDRNTRYSASPSAVGEQLGEEMAILHVESGTYFGLKGVGVDVWTLLERSPTLEEIVDHLTHEYEVDPVRCRADVASLLTRLVDAGLVKVEAGGNA